MVCFEIHEMATVTIYVVVCRLHVTAWDRGSPCTRNRTSALLVQVCVRG